jgi:hypothetical protein
MTDREIRDHDFAVGRVFPKIGERGETAGVLKFLSTRG